MLLRQFGNICDHAMFSKRASDLGFKLVTQHTCSFLLLFITHRTDRVATFGGLDGKKHV